MTMQQWRVVGADRETGDDRTITIDAGDEGQARRRAARRGLVVASASRVVDSIDYASPVTGAPSIASGGLRARLPTGRRLILLVAVVSLVAMCISFGGPSAFRWFEGDEPSDEEVWTAAKDAVRDELKSPSTAIFSGGSGDMGLVINAGALRYQVFGQVDAQNGFGAMIRNDFSVKLRHQGEDKFHVEYVRIDD